LYQAPPGAQQLPLPDFLNMPHLGHVIVLAISEVMAGELTAVVISVLAMSSRSGIGLRDTYGRVGTDVQTLRDIDPDESSNMPTLLAFECTQAVRQRCRLNDVAS